MNDELMAMQAMAAMRDVLVIRLFWTAATVLGSHALLRLAPLPARVRTVAVNVQLAILLAAWIALLVILCAAEAQQ